MVANINSNLTTTTEQHLYHVHDCGETAFLIDPAGERVDSAAYRRLIERLEDAERNARIEELSQIAHTLTWVQPADWRDYRDVRQCVYVVRPSAPTFRDHINQRVQQNWQRVVKIGMTTKGLSARRKELQQGYGGGLRVLYFAETDDAATAERGVHALFHADHIHGEWFFIERVAQYITGGAS